jgi:ATP-dependent Clp protease ATP-binding subunit ClpC
VLALTESEGVAATTLEHLGIDRDKVRQTLTETVVAGRIDRVPSGERPYTSRTKKALSFAGESARERGHAFIGPGDLIVGLMREGMNIGAQVLSQHGLTAASAFRMIRAFEDGRA